MLRMFAPKVFLFDELTTLDEHNLGIQAHVAVLIKFLILHSDFTMSDVLDKDGCALIDMDEIFQQLRRRYPD